MNDKTTADDPCEALFDVQLRLGCVERFYPGLPKLAYERFCQLIVDQHKALKEVPHAD